MMKTRLTFIRAAFLLSSAFTLVACGNDDETGNTAGTTPDGKVDVTRAVEFEVNFGDYNDDEELQGTRAARAENGDTLSQGYVELGNGLLAEVTVQKDTDNAGTNGQRTVTRALPDDTYTMLAYKGGVLQGTVTGTVSNRVFTPKPGATDGIVLDPGTYDFVLFNSKVARSGNNLTVTRADAETALIGRRTYTVKATPVKQKVTFEMQHAGARMRIQLTAYMDIKAGTAATLSSTSPASFPSKAVYNAADGTWSSGSGEAVSHDLTFPQSTEALYTSCTYTSKSGYMYFLYLTDPSKLRLRFTGGSIYRQDMKDAQLTLSVPTLPSMQAHGSYLINVRLLYNFIYLMSDGTTGLFRETTSGGGTKTPVGVVVRNKTATQQGLAVALKDANGGALCHWYKDNIFQQQNYRQFNAGDEAQSYDDMDGYKYTWESNAPGGDDAIKATKQTDYPAFYHAGNYGNELGITVSGSMAGKKWHLPSVGEWKYVFTTLSFGNEADLAGYFTSYRRFGCLADLAFTQVGGTKLLRSPQYYWSSSEMRKDHAGILKWLPSEMLEDRNTKAALNGVRAFVKY